MKKVQLLIALIPGMIIFGSCSDRSASGQTGDPAANKSDAPPGSGDDMYYEYTINTTGASMSISGTTKLYLSAGGGARSEMDMVNSADKQKGTGPIVLIANKDKPRQSILIDDDTKTYTVNNLDSLETGADPGKTASDVSKIGEDKILGYHCVHARIVTTKSMSSFFKSTDTIDLWKSPEVPVQAYFQNLMESFESRTGNFMFAPGVSEQLKQMGCTGFMVKMEMRSKNVSMTDQLTKVQKGDFPKSMFAIPAGYTEKKE